MRILDPGRLHLACQLLDLFGSLILTCILGCQDLGAGGWVLQEAVLEIQLI